MVYQENNHQTRSPLRKKIQFYSNYFPLRRKKTKLIEKWSNIQEVKILNNEVKITEKPIKPKKVND